MLKLLAKLDEKAAAWLNTMDNQLQEPLVRAMNGEVFTDGEASEEETEKVKFVYNDKHASNIVQKTEAPAECPKLHSQLDFKSV